MPPTPPFPNGATAYRPIVVTRLTVASTGKTLFCFSLPDSGADQCVFPSSFAIALGLDPLQMKQQITGGVGNSGNVTYYDNLRIEIGFMQANTAQGQVPGGNMAFVPKVSFDAYAGFTNGLEAQGIGLLGQSGFFENFGVTFDHKNRVFHIDAA